MKKTIMISLTFLLVSVLLVSYISAYQRLCLTYGQSIPSDENPRYTCWHDICQICVYDNLYPTAPYRCNGIKGCNTLGGGGIDQDPPQLTINSPINDEVYNSRKVLFDIQSNEPASLYYIDNINGRGKWKRLSSYTQSYSGERSFKDGFNDITIKGKDRNGNIAYIERQFYVDSKKPRIRRTYPKKGFANGKFEVQFTEKNPETLILHYGNQITEMRQAELDIENNCYYEKKRYYCNTEVDLDDYDGEQIEYWFELEDVAGGSDESKHIRLSVDITPPVINNPQFWHQGEGKYSKYIYFNINITEQNFDEVSYIDRNNKKPKWRRLCSRLKNGICEKKKKFKKGHHVVDIQITDEAGNAIAERIEFDV